MKWQPIETAPKDGTEFLGAISWSRSFKVSICRFQKGRYQPDYFARRNTHEPVNLTHWMPLPKPPEEQP